MKIYQRAKSQLWLVLVFAAFVLFSGNLAAQSELVATSSSSSTSTVQPYPSLVTESNAESMLEGILPGLEASMEQLTPNTPAYEWAERKYLMYMHTWENLTQGMLLEASLTSSYGEFAIDASGNDLGEDELPAYVVSKDPNFGDSIFEGLIDFLKS